jgi:hypothetical protein
MAKKVGRPTKYKKEYCEKIIEFFDQPLSHLKKKKLMIKGALLEVEEEAPIPLPTLAGFAWALGVTESTIWLWAQKHEEFSNAVALCKARQKEILIQNSLLGEYNAGFATLCMNNLHEWSNRQETKVSGSLDLHSQLMNELEK